MKGEALKMALDWAEKHGEVVLAGGGMPAVTAMNAWAKLSKAALAQPAQEPVAWAVVGDGKFGEYELGQVFVDYEATHTYWENRGYELVPVYTTPPQPEQERNFCPRCGKRTADLTTIHTCTPPPQEKNNG